MKHPFIGKIVTLTEDNFQLSSEDFEDETIKEKDFYGVAKIHSVAIDNGDPEDDYYYFEKKIKGKKIIFPDSPINFYELPEELKRFYMKKGNKIKSHIYKRGTKIKSYDEHQRDLLKQNIQSDYPTQNVETIWNDWTIEQRKHFLIDHEDRLIGLNLPLNKIVEFKNIKYENLPIEIANVLIKHIETGRYEHGTKIESTNERNENYYENVVNELLNDNAISTIRMKTYGCEIQPYSPVDDAYMLPIKLTRSDLLALIIKSNVEFMNYDEKQILNELQSMTRLLMKK